MQAEKNVFELLPYNPLDKKSKRVSFEKDKLYPMLQWFYVTVFMVSMIFLVWDELMQAVVNLPSHFGDLFAHDLYVSPFCVRGNDFVTWGNLFSVFATVFWGYFIERHGTNNLLFMCLCLLFSSFYFSSKAFQKINPDSDGINANCCFLLFLSYFIEKLGRVLPEFILTFAAINFKEWTSGKNNNFVPIVYSVSRLIMNWGDILVTELFYLVLIFLQEQLVDVEPGVSLINRIWFTILIYLSTGIFVMSIVMIVFVGKMTLIPIFSQFSEATSRLVYNFDHSQFYRDFKRTLKPDFLYCLFGLCKRSSVPNLDSTRPGEKGHLEHPDDLVHDNFEFILLTIVLGVSRCPFTYFYSYMGEWIRCIWFGLDGYCSQEVALAPKFSLLNLFHSFSLLVPPLVIIGFTFTTKLRYLLYSNLGLGLFLNTLGVGAFLQWSQFPFEFYQNEENLGTWPRNQILFCCFLEMVSSFYVTSIYVTSWFRVLKLFRHTMGCFVGISFVIIGSKVIEIIMESAIKKRIKSKETENGGICWIGLFGCFLQFLFCARLWLFQIRHKKIK